MSILSRRHAVVTGTALAAVSAANVVTIASVAKSAEPDPIFGAIETHRRAYEVSMDGTSKDDDELDSRMDYEASLMKRLLDIVPTSSAGIAALSHYAAELMREEYRCRFNELSAFNGEVDWSYLIHRNIAKAAA
jgi:hypothetical protein